MNVNDPEYWKSLSDIELELQMDKQPRNAMGSSYDLALVEMVRRKDKYKHDNDATQRSIKRIAFMTLIITLGILIASIALLLK
jgi:hypothetical protein